MLGDMAWAASPTSTTAPRPQRSAATCSIGATWTWALVRELVQQLWDGGGEAGEALAQPGQRVAGPGRRRSGSVVTSA